MHPKLIEEFGSPACVIILAAVLLSAVFVRVNDLGGPSFWGDEETSSIPARSYAMSGRAEFPSGLEYRRAPLHQYSMALSAKLLGTDEDASYRLPSVAFGIATLLVLMTIGSRHLGVWIATTATIILALSEWHVLLSRTARMYGPMMFFVTTFAISVAAYYSGRSRTDGLSLGAAALSYLLAASMNLVALMALPLLPLPAILSGKFRDRSMITLSLSVAIAAVSLLYTKYANDSFDVIGAGQTGIVDRPPLSGAAGDSPFETLIELSSIAGIAIALAFALGVFFLLVRRTDPTKDLLHKAGIMAVLLLAASSIATHSAYGVFATLLVMLAVVPPTRQSLQGYAAFVLVGGVLSAALLAHHIIQNGVGDGIRAALGYPFPYLLHNSLEMPGLTTLFFTGLGFAVFQNQTRLSVFIRSCALVVLTPPLLLGFVESWAPPRYFSATYPILVIVASYGLVSSFGRLSHLRARPALQLAVIVLIVASGVLGRHGILPAVSAGPAQHGENIYGNHLQGIRYPDHKSNALFVANRLRADDIIVAEDALQAYWYIGRVDYWLRTPANIFYFLYSDDGIARDVYAHSEPTTDAAIEYFETVTERRIWVITSGETRQYPDEFLHPGSEARRWLDELVSNNEPVHLGRDDMSATYCLNCATQESKPEEP